MHRDYANLPEVKLLQQYVQIDTSETTGDEVAGAEFLARQFQAAGIPYRIETVGPRKANLYAWLVGKDSRPLVLHNHIDVSASIPRSGSRRRSRRASSSPGSTAAASST